MTEQATNTAAEQEPQEGAEQEPKVFDADYVEKLRKESAKYRTEAKANAEAAKRLAEIEEANKTEVQKAADRIAAAEQKALEAERRALRFEIASEYQLSPENAKKLEHIPSEEGMREIAAALATRAAEQRKTGNYVPLEGSRVNNPTENQDAQFARQLFSPTT
jgi:hypothetical protein